MRNWNKVYRGARAPLGSQHGREPRGSPRGDAAPPSGHLRDAVGLVQSMGQFSLFWKCSLLYAMKERNW